MTAAEDPFEDPVGYPWVVEELSRPGVEERLRSAVDAHLESLLYASNLRERITSQPKDSAGSIRALRPVCVACKAPIEANSSVFMWCDVQFCSANCRGDRGCKSSETDSVTYTDSRSTVASEHDLDHLDLEQPSLIWLLLLAALTQVEQRVPLVARVTGLARFLLCRRRRS
jgi:hypothetical protein